VVEVVFEAAVMEAAVMVVTTSISGLGVGISLASVSTRRTWSEG
jgi:hypothetical protein